MNPLFYDNRIKLEGAPGVHVLIVGVSGYPYLPCESDPISDDVHKLGLRQLNSAALTAYKLARWIKKFPNFFGIPLVTCRLLLTPSEAEIKIKPEIGKIASPASLENFREYATAWREDARTSEKNKTIFYYAGHGLQRLTRNSHVLLFEEFGKNKNLLLEHAIETTDIFDGMAPTPTAPVIAHQQMYFLDACRVYPDHFKNFEEKGLKTAPLWDFDNSIVPDPRHTPYFHTAGPGEASYGIKGKQTIFSSALLKCLAGGASVSDICWDDGGDEQWCVTVYSLNEALNHYIRLLNEREQTAQNFQVKFLPGENLILHRLKKPPKVDLKLLIVPYAARNHTKVIIVDDDTDIIVDTIIPPIEPNPFLRRLSAGYYIISGEITPPAAQYKNFKPKALLVKPLIKPFPIKVAI